RSSRSRSRSQRSLLSSSRAHSLRLRLRCSRSAVGGFVLTTSFDFALALGVASVIGSRAIATVVVISWRNVLAPVLLAISFLGAAREGLPNAALERLLP